MVSKRDKVEALLGPKNHVLDVIHANKQPIRFPAVTQFYKFQAI